MLSKLTKLNIAKNRILISEQLNTGKIKYNDKILHQSKILKYYLENEGDKKKYNVSYSKCVENCLK